MAVLPISVPSLRPRQQNSLLPSLLKIGDAAAKHYQTQTNNKLLDLAAGGDENALIKLAGSNPNAAKLVYGMQQDRETKSQRSFLSDSIGALSLIAESEDPATAWAQYAPMIKQKYPDQAANIPDEYDPAFVNKQFLELAGMEGNWGKVGQSLASKFGILPQSTSEYAPSFDTQEIVLPDGRKQLAVFDKRTGQLVPQGEPYAAEASGGSYAPSFDTQEMVLPDGRKQLAVFDKRTGKLEPQGEPYMEAAEGGDPFIKLSPGGQLIDRQTAIQAMQQGGSIEPAYSAPYAPQRVGEGTAVVDPNNAQEVYQPRPKTSPAPYGAPPGAPVPEQLEAVGRVAAAKERAVQAQQLEFAGPKQAATSQAAADVALASKPQIEYAVADARTRQERAAELPQAKSVARNAISRIDNIKSNIKEITSNESLRLATGPFSWVNIVRGTPAYDAKVQIEALSNKLSLRALSEMREESKTGGAVGQVTEREWGFLANTFVALNQAQSYEQFRSELDKLDRYLDGSKQRIAAGFTDLYGEGLQGQGREQTQQIQQPQAPQQQPAQGAKTITTDYLQNLMRDEGISMEEARQFALDNGFIIR